MTDSVDVAGGADPRADRERVIEALKAAFVQGRLGKDEFDKRLAHALAAYAELDSLTSDIPVAPSATPATPATEPSGVSREAYNKGLVARGTLIVSGVVMLPAMIIGTALTGNPFAGFLLASMLGAVAAVLFGGASTLVLWLLESTGGRSGSVSPPGPGAFRSSCPPASR